MASLRAALLAAGFATVGAVALPSMSAGCCFCPLKDSKTATGKWIKKPYLGSCTLRYYRHTCWHFDAPGSCDEDAVLSEARSKTLTQQRFSSCSAETKTYGKCNAETITEGPRPPGMEAIGWEDLKKKGITKVPETGTVIATLSDTLDEVWYESTKTIGQAVDRQALETRCVGEEWVNKATNYDEPIKKELDEELTEDEQGRLSKLRLEEGRVRDALDLWEPLCDLLPRPPMWTGMAMCGAVFFGQQIREMCRREKELNREWMAIMRETTKLLDEVKANHGVKEDDSN